MRQEDSTLYSHLFGNSSVVVVGLLMLNLSSEDSVARKLFTLSESKILLDTSLNELSLLFQQYFHVYLLGT